MLRKHDVVMLPTEESNPVRVSILKSTTGKLVSHAAGGEFRRYLSSGFIPQHLYFVSNELPIKGDWATDGTNLVQWCNDYIGDNYKKIIATTNPMLWTKRSNHSREVERDIPKISTSFVEAFVKEQGKIYKVMLEYEDVGGEEWIGDDYEGEPFWNEILQLKLRHNGNVIIHPYKENTYLRYELVAACYEFKAFCDEIRKNGRTMSSSEWFDKHYPI